MRTETDRAWAELRAVLPDGWQPLPPDCDRPDGLCAVRTEYVDDAAAQVLWREAYGETEVIALRALARQFREATAA
jgi:hypothetical protein